MDQFISRIEINGLRGRMMHMSGPKNASHHTLFVYGHHSSLERWQGILELLSRRSAVTMPDLPGFGGMDSLYAIGKPATLDNLADYLAAFIEQCMPKKQKLTVVGMSLGFVIVTRMLQRHPELTARIEKLISLFGFAHKNDFILPPNRRNFFLWGSRVFAMPGLAAIYRTLFLNQFVLSRAYHRTPNAREKFKDSTPAEHQANMAFEIKLWQESDLRTYMKTGSEFLMLDNTRARIKLPVYHVAVAADRYFDNKIVEYHMRLIFTEFHLLAKLKNASHAPTQIANAKQAALLVPPALLDAIAPISG